MPWVRFDDQYPIHRKLAGLSDAQYRLANEAVFWSARNLTDGRIRAGEEQQIRPRVRASDVRVLVDKEIWHPAGTPCRSRACPQSGPDGWVIHDYLRYQPSRQKVERDREAARGRQQKWRDRRRDDDGRWV